MSELGIDILNGSKVILSRDRNSRPIECKFKSYDENKQYYDEECPFCRGNEYMLSKQTYTMKEYKNWIVKSVLNKFPIIDENSSNNLKGIHEVMVDTYRHNGNFYNMSEDEFYYLLLMYKDRYNKLSQYEESRYISIFKNHLREAGASLFHPHSQIMSLPFIPPELKNEYEICEDYYEKMGINMYKYIIEEEIKEKKRVIYNSEEFLVFIPEVSKFCGEILIIFKSNMEFQYIKSDNLRELSVILNKLFKNIYKENGNSPFNIYIHTHPIKEEKQYKDIFNVHMHIIPRKFNLGGFELSTGIYVSSGCPTDLVKKLKID